MIAIRGLLLVGDFSAAILTGGHILRKLAITRAAARTYGFAGWHSGQVQLFDFVGSAYDDFA